MISVLLLCSSSSLTGSVRELRSKQKRPLSFTVWVEVVGLRGCNSWTIATNRYLR